MIDIYAYEELNQEHIFLQDNHASDLFFNMPQGCFFYRRYEKYLRSVYFIEKINYAELNSISSKNIIFHEYFTLYHGMENHFYM